MAALQLVARCKAIVLRAGTRLKENKATDEDKEEEERQQEVEEDSGTKCGCQDHRDLNHFMFS